MSPHDEDHSSHRVGLLRAMVLGANDGIISTACLVLGVAAATAERSTILTAGMAGLVAGAASMALGEYVSVSSQRDSEQSDIAKEKWELEHTPDIELAELAGIYRKKGLPQALAQEVAVELTKHDALKTHLAEELGIHEATRARPVQASVGSAGSFAVGAAIPLAAVSLFSESMRFTGTIAVVVLTLVALGVSSSKYGGAKPARPVLRVVIGGLIAIAVTMAVGKLFGAAVA
ncbi:MAG: VIT1/CCC1 transporter family protein [Ilumatobacteraceae bacterium]